jgi:plasmid replication initiation protein
VLDKINRLYYRREKKGVLAMKSRKAMRVIQSNFLVEARFKLSLPQLKLFLFMIKEIDINDKDFKTYRIFIKDFLEDSKSKHRDLYSKADDITDIFMKHLLRLKEEDGSTSKVCLMSYCNYKQGRGYIKYRFDKALKPHLLRLKKQFTAYDIANIIHCKSTYSIRIYQLLKSFEGLEERTITVEKLKEMLMIEDEYKRFYDFKVNVLNKAYKELKGKPKNKIKSDLYFEYTLNKEGRKTESITFTIKKRKQQRMFDQKEETKYIDLTSKADELKREAESGEVITLSEFKKTKE